jgi:hypothetical protein
VVLVRRRLVSLGEGSNESDMLCASQNTIIVLGTWSRRGFDDCYVIQSSHSNADMFRWNVMDTHWFDVNLLQGRDIHALASDQSERIIHCLRRKSSASWVFRIYIDFYK